MTRQMNHLSQAAPLSPSPGTPGEGRGEGFAAKSRRCSIRKKTLTLTLSRSTGRGKAAFTLVELMISIALVVLLLLGINQVFKMSSDTIGVGQTYSEIVRNARAAQTVMEQDAQQWAVEGPLFYIWNQAVAAGSPRRDRLAFPARGLYRRQTGTTSESSLEAWVWYGHGHTLPDHSRNVLCRMAMLLKDPLTMTGSYVAPQPGKTLSALTGSGAVFASDCDVAGMTLEQLRANIHEYERQNPPPPPPTPAPTPAWAADLRYAFECNIRPGRPITQAALAKAAPALLENCEEFIVEFAGDLYAQDGTGRPTSRGADGTLDYVVVNATGERRPRWYGLGRDTDGDGIVKWEYDTVTPADFEAMTAAPMCAGAFEHTFSLGSPKLVRVLIKVVDPGGRLREPQWFEFVLGPQ